MAEPIESVTTGTLIPRSTETGTVNCPDRVFFPVTPDTTCNPFRVAAPVRFSAPSVKGPSTEKSPGTTGVLTFPARSVNRIVVVYAPGAIDGVTVNPRCRISPEPDGSGGATSPG